MGPRLRVGIMQLILGFMQVASKSRDQSLVVCRRASSNCRDKIWKEKQRSPAANAPAPSSRLQFGCCARDLTVSATTRSSFLSTNIADRGFCFPHAIAEQYGGPLIKRGNPTAV